MTVADADRFSMRYLAGGDGRTTLVSSGVRVYSNDPRSPSNASDRARLQGYDGSSNGDPFDYAVLDVATGHATRFVLRSTASSISVSDDGRYALLLRQSGVAADAPDQALYDLSVISFPQVKTELVVRDVPMAANWNPSWQPHRDAFIYTTGARRPLMATKLHGEIGQTYLVTVPNGDTR